MPRKRRIKPPWGVIHDELTRIVERMRPYKTGRDYYNMVYFGNEQDLKEICLRILAALDIIIKENEDLERIEKEKVHEHVAETGRTQVLDYLIGPGGSSVDRTKKGRGP